MILRRFLPSLALFATGCATVPAEGGGYPSLARRPMEIRGAEQASGAGAAVSADPAVDAAVMRFSAQSAVGAAAFDSGYDGARRLVGAASGAAVSSEAWVAAQAAITTLESGRNDSVSALASLDTLYVERAQAIADGKAAGGIDAIDAARAGALAAVDSQNDRLDALKAMLTQP